MDLHRFSSGTVAHAAEMNDNFDAIMSILASMGAVDRLGELQIGPRGTGLITAAQDTGGTAGNFLQFSWNADWNKVGSAYQFSRILPQGPATAMRVGANGFEVLLTDAEPISGNLVSQMKTVFRLKAYDTRTDGNYMFLPSDFHISNRDAYPADIQNYRLTYTPLKTPPAIFNDAYLSKNVWVKKATDYGVPARARAISVFAYVTATDNSGAGFKIYQERAGRSERYGFTTHAALGAWGVGQRAGGWGVVPLGEGVYLSSFVIETTAAFDTARVYVVGYWI